MRRLDKSEKIHLYVLVMTGEIFLVTKFLLVMKTSRSMCLFFGNESAAVSDGMDGSGVLIQNIDSFERQSLWLSEKRLVTGVFVWRE